MKLISLTTVMSFGLVSAAFGQAALVRTIEVSNVEVATVSAARSLGYNSLAQNLVTMKTQGALNVTGVGAAVTLVQSMVDKLPSAERTQIIGNLQKFENAIKTANEQWTKNAFTTAIGVAGVASKQNQLFASVAAGSAEPCDMAASKAPASFNLDAETRATLSRAEAEIVKAYKTAAFFGLFDLAQVGQATKHLQDMLDNANTGVDQVTALAPGLKVLFENLNATLPAYIAAASLDGALDAQEIAKAKTCGTYGAVQAFATSQQMDTTSGNTLATNVATGCNVEFGFGAPDVQTIQSVCAN